MRREIYVDGREARELAREKALGQQLYFGSIFLGASLIILTSAFPDWIPFAGEQQGNLLLPAILIVALMLSYLAVSFGQTPSLIRSSDFADSFYYMGFVFTLIALVTALSFMGREGGDLAVLPQFGLGLSSTIIGMLGKLRLSIYTEDDPRDAEELRHELRETLRAAIDAGEDYRRLMSSGTEMTEGAIRGAGTSLEAAIKRLQEPLDNSIRSMKQQLDHANQLLSEKGEQLTDSIESLSFKLSDAVSGLAGAISESQEDFRTLGGVLPEVQVNLSGLATEAGNVVEQMAEVRDSFGSSLTESADALSTSAQKVVASTERIEQVTSSMLAAVEGGQEGLTARIKQSTEAVDMYVKQLDATARALGTGTEELLAQSGERLNEPIEKWAQQMDAATRDLDTGTRDLLTRSGDQMKAGIEQWATQLRAQTQAVGAGTEGVLETHRARLNTAVEEFVRQVDTATQAMESGSEKLTTSKLDVRLQQWIDQIEELRSTTQLLNNAQLDVAKAILAVKTEIASGIADYTERMTGEQD